MNVWIDNIVEGGIRAKELVAQILAFSRPDEIHTEPVSPRVIIKEVVRLLKATLPESIDIRQNLNSESMILADVTKIHQLLMNLCTNAGYAMKESGGLLTLSLKDVKLDKAVASHKDISPGLFLCLGVRDTGLGMDEKMCRKIMEPFFTTKPRGEGTGMGLWVTLGIVKDLSGFMEVSSKPGLGSRFDVYIPVLVQEHPVSEYKDNSHGELLSGEERIMFVDDEQILTRLAAVFLKSKGYQVSTFNSAPKALEHFKLKPDHYDLVITDMTMPEMAGDEFSRQIRFLRPDISIILSTGILEGHDFHKSGLFDAILEKPVSVYKMASEIRRVLSKSKS